MKIVNFAINNFRGISGGIAQNRIDFNELNTLLIYGQNNTGKSTFLKAYGFFYEDAFPEEDDYYRKDSSSPIEIEIEVELDEFDRVRIETNAPKAKESYKNYLIEGSRIRLRTEITGTGKSKSKKNFTWNPDNDDWEEKGYASVGLHRVFQSCLPKPIHIKAMPTEEEAKTVLNEILKAIAESKLGEKDMEELASARDTIKKLQDKLYDRDTIDSYKDSVNSYMSQLFPDVKVGIEDKKDRVVWTENKLGRDFDISFQKLGPTGAVDEDLPDTAQSIGHGTIRTAIFTLLLMRDIAEEFERIDGRKDYIVLFEEPELFLYPKVIRELRQLIYDVSAGNTPYQLLCASHSPAMIDISQLKSSIIRLVKSDSGTRLFQVSDGFLKTASESTSDAEFKQQMYEVLRFNPYVCESFYADEVILVEGPTEEVILRAYLQEHRPDKFFYILNCGTVNNIPFYQRILAQFCIPYSVICDTDTAVTSGQDDKGNPMFDTGIQKSISEKFHHDREHGNNPGIFRTHEVTFEPAHRSDSVPESLRMPDGSSHGKPYDANLYWRSILLPALSDPELSRVPIIGFIREILEK